jgi:ribonuclease BN (tRNA processing enzyme)
VDLLLAEASFVQAGPNPADLHLTGRQAGSMAQTAGAARLVVTHVPPWHDPQVARAEAQAAFDGPVEFARTGATYDL